MWPLCVFVLFREACNFPSIFHPDGNCGCQAWKVLESNHCTSCVSLVKLPYLPEAWFPSVERTDVLSMWGPCPGQWRAGSVDNDKFLLLSSSFPLLLLLQGKSNQEVHLGVLAQFLNGDSHSVDIFLFFAFFDFPHGTLTVSFLQRL